MPTVNEELFDAYVRHQTFLLRYAGGLRNELIELLTESEIETRRVLIHYLNRLPDRDLTSAKSKRWVASLTKALNRVRGKAWDKVDKRAFEDFKQLALNEATVASTFIAGAVPATIGLTIPPVTQLSAVVNAYPFEGRTLKQWMRRTRAADVDRMLNAAKVGVIQGLTPTVLTRQIIGTKRAKFRNGLMRKAFRDMEAVLLTVTSGVQNEAKQLLYKENADIIEEELYIATLDARTTIECAALDHTRHPIGDGPMPPRHIRCRSLRVPLISAAALHLRGFDSRTERELLQEYTNNANLRPVTTRSALPYGHKLRYDAYTRSRADDLVGQVPAKVSYSEWLEKQTVAFQNQVLGRTRAQLFRRGEITLDKFIARNGDTLTLDQLRNRGLNIPD